MLELVSLEVINFRSIEYASLKFDETTLLIGENDSGKFILMEALSAILDPQLEDKLPEFSTFQFYKDPEKEVPEEKLQIKLLFQLNYNKALNASKELELLMVDPQEALKKKPKLEVSFVSHLSGSVGTSEWSCTNLQKGTVTKDTRALGAIRKIVPVIHLRFGILTGFLNMPESIEGDTHVETDHENQLRHQIFTSVNEIILGTTQDTDMSLNKGFEAVETLLQFYRQPNEVQEGEDGVMLRIREILQMVALSEQEHIADTLKRFHRPTEKLAALMLVHALLKSNSTKFEKYTRPILILQHPEAFLHKTTLATIGILLSRIQWQKILTTNSGILLSRVPLKSIRMLRRKQGIIQESHIDSQLYTNEDLRRLSYHLRSKYSSASFDRFWILVEGESEFWILPHLARIMNYEFWQEGISVIDFAQSGLKPLLKYATDLGIGWHVLVDGDEAGLYYEKQIQDFANKHNLKNVITRLKEKDIEHYFWHHGFEKVFIKAAKSKYVVENELKPGVTIRKAVKNKSKPYLALSIIEAIAAKGSSSIPDMLYQMIESCIALARKN
ncbi:DUF2813 domain-containing protein [uncultured Eudoraea sp.]|uniref:ATP-dependent nuclease n=1 Tax=uncultured Eudoraea sp. TaxID=1035614 RepID=UPI00261FA6DD|nr:DUF2813 domain-containing protein [uncultured Eudoraea sp.]